MKSRISTDGLIAPDLLPAIRAAAEEERRAPRDLVTEAVERYLSERRWFRRDEVHTKIAQGLESLRQGKGLDGETVMAELLAELDAPENPPEWLGIYYRQKREKTSAKSGITS